MKRVTIFLIMLVFITGCSIPHNTNSTVNNDNSTSSTIDSTDDSNDDVVETTTTTVWTEYNKTDDFGDPVERTISDPQFYAEIQGIGQLSTSVNENNATFAFLINDHALYGNNGEEIFILPVFSWGSKAVSFTDESGHVKAKASGGKKLEGTTHFYNGLFRFTDSARFFAEHLSAGEDIKVILTTDRGGYTFKFEVPAANYSEKYEELASKMPAKE